MIDVVNDLGTAAANIHHDAVRVRYVLRCADKVVRRLLLAADDADGNPRTARDLLHGGTTVGRRAQRRRCKGVDVRNAEGLDKLHKSAQDLNGLFDPFAHEPPVIEIAREANRVLALQEERERPALDLIDRHADGVGADVNDRVQHRLPLQPAAGDGDDDAVVVGHAALEECTCTCEPRRRCELSVDAAAVECLCRL